MRIFENCIFNEPVVANEDAAFIGCQFTSGDTAKKAGVFGLTAAKSANLAVKNCKFQNKGYSAVYMNTNGTVEIENCVVDCTGLYNPIEGASSGAGAALSHVVLKNNVMNGICGNNYFNFYKYEDGAKIELDGNRVNGMSQQSEVVRISNLNNTAATFDIKNTAYTYDMDTAFDADWTKFILCQDYTGNKGQDFSKITINVENLMCNGIPVKSQEEFPVGGLLVVYDNKANGGSAEVISDNNPVINF